MFDTMITAAFISLLFSLVCLFGMRGFYRREINLSFLLSVFYFLFCRVDGSGGIDGVASGSGFWLLVSL